MKELFNIPDDVTYLNCAYMGPFLKSSVEEGRLALDRRTRPWETPLDNFFSPAEEVRSLFAHMVNSSAENIAIIPSASYGIATAAKAFRKVPGGKIIVLQDQFPSNIYEWQEFANDWGHEIITIPRKMENNITQNILDTIDENTSIVAIAHVHWCDGLKLDLKKIASKTRSVNAKLVIDGTQSIGAIPFDTKEIKPDFLITASYKWLWGPYSLGVMYVADEHFDKSPLEQNWINRWNSDNFKELVNYQTRYLTGARRFDMGEKSQFQAMPILINSLKTISKIGVQEIRKHCSELNQNLKSMLESRHEVYFWDSDQQAENILGIYFRNSETLEHVKETLTQNKVYVSYRGDSMRVSPNIYNSREDIKKLVQLIIQSL